VGYRDETVCDGERCRLVRVPVVARRETEVLVYAGLRAVPRRATLAAQGEIVAEVSLLSPRDGGLTRALGLRRAYPHARVQPEPTARH
jgi:hypothetical protein